MKLFISEYDAIVKHFSFLSLSHHQGNVNIWYCIFWIIFKFESNSEFQSVGTQLVIDCLWINIWLKLKFHLCKWHKFQWRSILKEYRLLSLSAWLRIGILLSMILSSKIWMKLLFPHNCSQWDWNQKRWQETGWYNIFFVLKCQGSHLGSYL